MPVAANQTYVKELEAKLESINQRYDSLVQQVNFLFNYVWCSEKIQCVISEEVTFLHIFACKLYGYDVALMLAMLFIQVTVQMDKRTVYMHCVHITLHLNS